MAARKLPPVSTWRPAHVGDSHMRIAADGAWFHEGSPISRPAMVRAFASLLMRDEAGQHWLVTPHEKLRIAVEDAPLVAIDVTRTDDALVFRLNTDEIVVAGPDHPLRATGDPQTPAIYLAVRNGCEARLNRSTYAQAAALAMEEGEDWSLSSLGTRFSMVPA